ncbi:MAG: PQQ-binding-like beta-propeller repeat protein [Deltaproteobacteria bacterium]|nr:PQQ-binding-like beta-propeller repeat protein [Deltaproteobacteria bacterium]
MRRSILLLWASVALLAGCQAKPQQPSNRELWYDARWPYALVQANLYELAAYDTVDGVERWRYRREQPPAPPFGHYPVPTVICRPVWMASQNIVLRYADGLHVITADKGELLWSQDVPFRGHCPTVTPDSGIVMIVEHGGRLQKWAGDGRILWHHDFWETGHAIAQPIVVEPSGDTLIRTAKFLLNISPDGRRNWVAPTRGAPESG